MRGRGASGHQGMARYKRFGVLTRFNAHELSVIHTRSFETARTDRVSRARSSLTMLLEGGAYKKVHSLKVQSFVSSLDLDG